MAEIAAAIHLGAMVFMRREYRILTIFSAILLVFLLIVLGWQSALAFLVGALTSGIAGYIGMNTATQANVRTTTAAHTKGADALTVAFFGGSIMGLAVASWAFWVWASSTSSLVVTQKRRTRFTASAWVLLLWHCFRVLAVASSRRVRRGR